MPILNTPIRELPTGCGTCPDVILGLISGDVTEMLGKVRKVKRVVTCINRYTHYAANLLIDELQRLLDMIPEPPQFNLQLLAGMLTCPLTPQALFIEQFDRAFTAAQKAANGVNYPPRFTVFTSTLSKELFSMTSVVGALERPRDTVVRVLRIIEGFANRLREMVNEFMDDLSGVDNTGFTRLAYRLAEELRNTFRDADEYLLKLVVTQGSVALVKTTCPAVYERTDMPFKAFDSEMTSFSFNGIIPSGFQGESARIMSLFAQINLKIARWQSASFLVVT